ncbi:MAPK/MAK/MRK overlapping kinase isoform X3 [Oopsacas minuta]|uniref:MAPK/MAK/MRK overlapping kinase isoform X3 n=1 Tax=Oopsacas minuta TaxID=111878 RepID=A0AAV7K416_9METZ|nr:MAPK/MAK/MRK overlapping kinase isoform X3 [Oopsacas minuta]
MKNYCVLNKIGEGTFSEVLKCQSLKDGKIYALKKLKKPFKNMDDAFGLLEVQAMKKLGPHPNIIHLKEVIYDKRSQSVLLVTEMMDMNAYELIKGRRSYITETRLKPYMYQLMKSLHHMHKYGYFHRDVKPENILIKDDQLKLADFGSCRLINTTPPYTEYISTRWYRAPECILTNGDYSSKMDMWSAGCVFYEIMTLRPLFPGTDEFDQINKIHDCLGTPSKELLQTFVENRNKHIPFDFEPKTGTGFQHNLKHASSGFVDLLKALLVYDPNERLVAKAALKHPYFREFREAEQRIIAQNNARRQKHATSQSSYVSLPTISASFNPLYRYAANPCLASSTSSQAMPHIPKQRYQYAPKGHLIRKVSDYSLPSILGKKHSKDNSNSYI